MVSSCLEVNFFYLDEMLKKKKKNLIVFIDMHNVIQVTTPYIKNRILSPTYEKASHKLSFSNLLLH